MLETAIKGRQSQIAWKWRNKTKVTKVTLTLYDVEIRKVEYQWQQPRQSHVQEWRLDGVHSHS